MSNDDLNKKVTERIQDQLLMILPEEEIRRRVDEVIDNFFAEKRSSDSWGNTRQVSPSDFANIVNAHLKNKVDSMVAQMFQSDAWKVTLNERMEVRIGEALQAVLKVTPQALELAVADQIALRRANDLMMVLTNAMRNHMGTAGFNLAQDIMNYYASTVQPH